MNFYTNSDQVQNLNENRTTDKKEKEIFIRLLSAVEYLKDGSIGGLVSRYGKSDISDIVYPFIDNEIKCINDIRGREYIVKLLDPINSEASVLSRKENLIRTMMIILSPNGDFSGVLNINKSLKY